MDATAHGEVVLSAIIGGSGSAKALDYASTRLSPGHFDDPRQQKLFTLLTRYQLQTHGIMTRTALEDLLRGRAAGTRLALVEYYDALAKVIPKRHEFLHSVDQLRILAAEGETLSVFTVGAKIMREPDGVRLDEHTVLVGHEDARAYVLGELARIEADLLMAESPEGDAHDDADDVLAAYARAKDLHMRGEAPGVLFGVASLDRFIEGGVAPGEMALIRAGTTIGKSRFCVQHAWHTSVVQGKHVVYFTTETSRPQICTNLIARHSRLPQFEEMLAAARRGRFNDGDLGLNARKIRAGRLTTAEEAVLDLVIKDFKTGDYGRLRVVQMPEHCTMSALAGRFSAIEKAFSPELVIADYLQLFEPERRTRESKEWESQAGILKRAERWCGAARKGRGVAFVTPWQVNRGGRSNLRTSGKYTLEDSAGTQEASNTPDIVLDLLDREEDTSAGRRVPLVVAVMKVRDGPRGRQFDISADYATCYFTDREQPAEIDLDLEATDA
jgi:replicative DNA helicase